MKKLEYEINVNATAKKVWDTMLHHGTYEIWSDAGWPNSTFEGDWNERAHIKFIGPSGEGTLVKIIQLISFKLIKAEHIAVLLKEGKEDRESETAKTWIGSKENYYFGENNGTTHLKVEIECNPEWEKIFNDGWPNALSKLKEICEQ